MTDTPTHGAIAWLDLTVDEGDRLRDFYADVVGWTPGPVPMGEGAYEDYVMKDANGAAVAGVCWRRGCNANMPPAWMPYIAVDDLSGRVERAVAQGASIVDDRRDEDGSGFVVIKDPAGAVIGLYGI